MRNIWFISDTHFGHANIIKHANRPFADATEMDDVLAQNWCKNIKPDDLVYHLGDISWTDKGLKLFGQLPGVKRLLIGNHDDGKKCAFLVQRLELFRKFREFHFVASHMPMLPGQIRGAVNVHGHTHDKNTGNEQHLNISVEKTNYEPVHLDDLLAMVNKRISSFETV